MTEAIAQERSAAYAREVRLGLVLYGGISLAIYMNGIANEFFRAVRGRGLYGFIKKITNSEVIVDIISGTSAGGINGIFLAFALANGAEFGACAELWRKRGALGDLLRNPLSGPSFPSFFDTDKYYIPQIKNAFETMLRNKTAEIDEMKGACAAPLVDLDLFITGTDFYGDASTKFDDGGHAIDTVEFRSLFHLKHETRLEGQESDLAARPENEALTIASLSKLAALTSCFPVAFEPVKIGAEPENDLIRQWGKLPAKRKFFIDGGVLANKPFTPTIEAIFRRTAEREVNRYLCYVEPNPESLNIDTPITAPTVAETAVGALSTLPGYQGISSDLDEVTRHNSSVEQYRRMCKAARNKFTGPPQFTEIYRKARLLSIADRALQGIFRTDGRDPLRTRAAKEAAALMVNCFEDNIPDLNNNHYLEDLDIYFHRRRLTHLVYWIYGELYPKSRKQADRPESSSLSAVWKSVNERIRILEILQDQMQCLIDDFNFGWECKFLPGMDPQEGARKLWDKVLQVMRAFLQAGAEVRLPVDATSKEELTKFRQALKDRADYLKRKAPESDPTPFVSLLKETEAEERAIFEAHLAWQNYPGFREEYTQFEWLDNLTYPAELVSNLDAKDLIKTIRFSPNDATVGACGLSPKVLGRQLGSFGGFLKEDWRRNDIFFGRLDGCCQLAELLLDKSSGADLRSSKENRDIQELFLKPDGHFKEGCAPQNFFPNCKPEILEPAFRAAISGCWTPGVIAALVEAEHHEIFLSEYPEAEKPPFGTLNEYLRTKHAVRKQTVRDLVGPNAVPVVVKAVFAVLFVGAGLAAAWVSKRKSK